MPNRPLGVTLVAIIAWLSGFFQIIGSIFAIVVNLFITWPAILGWISLIVGIVTLTVGVGLWRGRPTARTIAAIVFMVTIILEAVGLFSGESFWTVLGGAILPIIGLILLYTRDARAYFGS